MVYDVVVRLWFTTVVANVLAVLTWTVYEVAPEEAVHASVGVVVLVVVPVVGEERTGAAGGGEGVVNDHADGQPRQPVTPVAFTRQKYCVVPARAGVVNDTAVVSWFTTVVANVLTVLTWTV